MGIDIVETASLSFLLSLSVPVAILFSRFAVKRRRQATLTNLREIFKSSAGYSDVGIPSFEFALHKYDIAQPWVGEWTWSEVLFYFFTMTIFAAISAVGMILLFHTDLTIDDPPSRFLLIGMRALDHPKGYELTSSAVIAFTFLGAYVWCLLYLIRRISSYDLTPMSFLRASAQIIFACALAVTLRHIVSDIDIAGGGMILLIGFVIGMAPNAGLEYLLRKVPQLRMKRVEKEVSAAYRSMPVEMIDGIDSQMSFRLAEREIIDVQGLAAENPILLCTETPYTLLACLDWIAQAQLALEVGPKAYRSLREIGIRTIFALECTQSDKQLEKLSIDILYETVSVKPDKLECRIAGMKSNLHVARLYTIWRVINMAINSGSEPPESLWHRSAPTHAAPTSIAVITG